MEGFDEGWSIKKIPQKTQGIQLSQVNCKPVGFLVILLIANFFGNFQH